jgi:hypothetical protein
LPLRDRQGSGGWVICPSNSEWLRWPKRQGKRPQSSLPSYLSHTACLAIILEPWGPHSKTKKLRFYNMPFHLWILELLSLNSTSSPHWPRRTPMLLGRLEGSSQQGWKFAKDSGRLSLLLTRWLPFFVGLSSDSGAKRTWAGTLPASAIKNSMITESSHWTST